jgi:hypothetical protein
MKWRRKAYQIEPSSESWRWDIVGQFGGSIDPVADHVLHVGGFHGWLEEFLPDEGIES